MKPNPKNKESIRSRWMRRRLNFFPSYRRSGGRITYLSENYKEVWIKLSLNRNTRNYVGTVFGGSIYAAMDPIYMFQLIHILGDDYIVWDKSANIKFLKPIRDKVYACFRISDDIILKIKDQVNAKNKYTFTLSASFTDNSGVTYAQVEKELYVAVVNKLRKTNKNE